MGEWKRRATARLEELQRDVSFLSQRLGVMEQALFGTLASAKFPSLSSSQVRPGVQRQVRELEEKMAALLDHLDLRPVTHPSLAEHIGIEHK